MKKRNSFIFLTAMILTLIWTGIGGAEEIVVGYTGPLSGPAAEYGQDCVNGIDTAINEINSKGGIVVNGRNYTFRLEKMDDGIKPDVAVSNALKMRQEQKAIAIFSPVFNTMPALMKVNTDRKTDFLLMGYTSMPQASEMGNKLTVIMTMPFTIYNKVHADLAWEKGWRKGAIVVTSGAYGDGWRKAFREEWEKKGGVITVDKAANYYTRTDFAAPLAEALASNPDFLLIGGPSATTALVIDQARAKGFEGGFVMIDQAKFDTIRAAMQKPLGLEGSFGTAMVSSIRFPATDAFMQNYANNYKRPVTWEVVINYAGMYALSQAIAVAGTTTDVRSIRAAFPKVFPILGDRLPMEINGITPNGRFIISASIQTMKHGKFTPAILYVWWAKTQKEFDAIRKQTKGSTPMVWKRID